MILCPLNGGVLKERFHYSIYFFQQKCLTLLSTNALLMFVRARVRVNKAPAIKEKMIKMGECGNT